LTPLPRWLGIALLLVIAVTFSLNHVFARIAFDPVPGPVGGTALLDTRKLL